MCSGGCARCLGFSLLPLMVLGVLCNILLFFPGGNFVNNAEHISVHVWYSGGILGSGLMMIFPVLVFLGLKNNDCCGCCGNESCGRSFAMLSSMLFAGLGLLGAGYTVIVSAVAINQGPKCQTSDTEWTYPFSDGNYLKDHSLWKQCVGPEGVVSWNLALFAVLLTTGLVQAALCAFQVINGLLGALCGGCCGEERTNGAV